MKMEDYKINHFYKCTSYRDRTTIENLLNDSDPDLSPNLINDISGWNKEKQHKYDNINTKTRIIAFFKIIIFLIPIE